VLRIFSLQHLIHADVVRFGESVRDELKRKRDAEFDGVWPGLGAQAIVEATTAPEATTVSVEGEARAKEGVDRCNVDYRQGGRRFADAERAGQEIAGGIGDRVKDEPFVFHPRENPSMTGKLRQ